jgi:uncharacterized glyoxalase superfamily protein PhnB
MVIPYIASQDVEGTLKFFSEKLGFALQMSLPGADGKTNFGIVTQGESITVMVGKPDASDQGKLGTGVQFWLYPPDVDLDAFFNDVKAKGVTIVEEITDGYWGDRFFTVTDPNGYRFTFAKTIRQVTMDDITRLHAEQA